MISATDIIRQDLARGGFTQHERQFMAGLETLVKSGRAQILRYQNTLALLIDHGTNPTEFHFYTLDPLPVIRKAFTVFYDEAKQMGLRHLVSQTESLALVNIAKGLGMNIQATKNQNGYAVILEVQ